MTKEELRQCILAIVNNHGQVTEAGIWRVDAPNFLPYSEAIITIAKFGKIKLWQSSSIKLRWEQNNEKYRGTDFDLTNSQIKGIVLS